MKKISNRSIKIIFFDFLIMGYLLFIGCFILKDFDKEVFFSHTYLSSLFAFILFLAFFLSFICFNTKILTIGKVVFFLQEKENVPYAPWYLSFWKITIIIVFVFSLIVSIHFTHINIPEMLKLEGIKGASRLVNQLLSPNLNIASEVVYRLVETVYMAFLATIAAIPIAIVLSFFCSKNIMVNPFMYIFYFLLRILLNIIRSIEPIIWAIIFCVWVGIGPFAGVLALMLHSIFSLTKQYSEIVECVHEGHVESIKATGAGFLQVIRYGVLPQVILPFISYSIYRWDINVRMATIVGMVGGGGIGSLLIIYSNQSAWSEVGTIIFSISIVVWLIDFFSSSLRQILK